MIVRCYDSRLGIVPKHITSSIFMPLAHGPTEQIQLHNHASKHCLAVDMLMSLSMTDCSLLASASAIVKGERSIHACWSHVVASLHLQKICAPLIPVFISASEAASPLQILVWKVPGSHCKPNMADKAFSDPSTIEASSWQILVSPT